MEKELQYLGKALENPEPPFIAILGGAKVSDKIGVIRNLMSKVDSLIIGGGMAYTFLKAQGQEIGKSLLEADKVELARQLLEEAKQRNVKILLPIDHVVAMNRRPTRWCSRSRRPTDSGRPHGAGHRSEDDRIVLGGNFACPHIVWNGPMGVFEVPGFSRGTFKIAHAVAENVGAISIVGGGDTVSAVHGAEVADKMTHISTGGGASLEFLEGKKLPGVEALTDKK